MPSDRLDEYRAKRDPSATPEPFGGEGSGGPQVFVVQLHAARRLHYDLRLEVDGVLQSWAVPQGPSLDPSVKRLAIQTEDHPMEYADFEGVIPEGSYGAGAMIVWDQGRYLPLPVTEKEAESGKLLFELRGHKLRGTWTLFPTNRDQREWLLIKKKDGWHRAEGEYQPPAQSVLSGLTVEELGAGASAGPEVAAELAASGVPRFEDDPAGIRPMLAQHRHQAFTRAGWIFELKYDGYRLIAGRRGGDPILRYRRGSDAARLYPDVARALLALPFQEIVVDGELVILDDDGRPNFQRLQRRAQLSRPPDIARGAIEHPATLYVFDLLAFEGFDLRDLPLVERKRHLARLMPRLGVLRYADEIPTQGEALFDQVRAMGLEGIVAKRSDSPYRSERSEDWLKIRHDRKEPFVIIGWRPLKGQATGVGALHVAAPREEGLAYAGRVGSGFSDQDRRQLEELLGPLRQSSYPLTGTGPTGDENQWVRPQARCEVRYKEWTEEGNLRHPVFLGLLPDPYGGEAIEEEESPPPPNPGPDPGPDRAVPFTNLDKVFWPDEGYTKGDLIGYYRRLSKWILPYLRDRPLVLDRYPDGIEGKSFYQKNAPDYVREWVETVEVWSGDPPKAIEYFVCNDQDSLLYLANLGAIPLHLWASRVEHLDRPDWSILDLDPKGAPFADVATLALAAHELCEEIGLPSFVKTSGSSGLHVLVPLAGACDYTQSRLLAELLARVINGRHPRISTLLRNPASRQGRVYLDYLQNRRGQLLAAPFSLRPLPGAPASTPLRWNEVSPSLDIRRFHLRSLPRRMAALKEDPLRPVLEIQPDLTGALARLGEILGG